MIAKFVTIVCLIGVAQAAFTHYDLYGNGLGYTSGYDGYGGYGGYGGYKVAPTYGSYATPIVKAIAPVVSYAPATSSVSRYDIHSSTPIVKSYVAPATSYYSPVPSYGGYGYGYGRYGGKYQY